jgi:hypothetical protein
MVVFLFFLTFLLSTVVAETQDCDNLSGMYFCIDSDTLKEGIDWCWCNSLDNPGRWILYPDTFVNGGYVATQIFFDPKIPDLWGRYWNTAVRSNVCSPTTHFPVYIGDIPIYVFVVSYDYKTRRNQIISVGTYTVINADCMYPSLSSKITVIPPGFVCSGGPNLDRDIKYIQMAKFGQNECSLCKCIEPPPIKQCNLPCSRENYDKRRDRNFCSLGCALSSLVSVMQYLGCNVDPCVVNRCNECFNNKGNVIWGIIIQKYCRDKLNSNVRVEDPPKDIQTWKTFCKDNEQGIYRILQVTLPGRSRRGYHFVVFKCIDDQGNILTMDPAYNIKYKPENVVSIRVIRKK